MHPLALGVRLGEFRQQVTSIPITPNDIGSTTQTEDMFDDMLSISLRIFFPQQRQHPHSFPFSTLMLSLFGRLYNLLSSQYYDFSCDRRK
jgi:hypothetical protein